MKIRTTLWGIRMTVIGVVLAAVMSPTAAAQPAFTYQGQLKQGGVPVTGSADFEFHLWDAETGGTELASNSFVGVTLDNGLFTVQLAFDAGLFDGSPRYLEVRVAVPSGGALTPLAGRQPITSVPYALYALDAPGGSDSWALAGNAGTTPGANFVGTTDDQPLELRVGGVRALRIEPNDMSPNLIGGYRENMVSLDVVGATISGGGSDGATNRVTDEGGTIGGGKNNQAGDDAGTTLDASDATVAGGYTNTASGLRSTVSGGRSNTASGTNSTVGGGYNNNASNGNSIVSGGANNNASGSLATIAGGYINTGSGDMSTIGGGKNNTANGYLTTIPGGAYNEASGSYSLAAGQRAQAFDIGTFVWSDSTTTDPDFFYSTGPNQFLIKATGGVGINTNAPGAALHIGGAAGVDGLMFPDGSLQTTAATGGGGGLWTPSGSNIYYNAGNVGIGTTSPSYPLHIDTSTGKAVYARNTRSTGFGAAFHGRATGTSGVGVYGVASAGSGLTHGILGSAFSPDGFAVEGYNEAETGSACGVYGRSESEDGIGVYGYVPEIQGSGSPIAVYGKMDEWGGRAVYGEATTTSGVNYAVRGHTNSGTGYAAYFTGGRNYLEGNVGIGEEDPQTTLHLGGTPSVDGIMFPDGTLQTTAATGGGTSVWSSSGSDIFYNSGYVGIGTSSPVSRLHIVGPDDPVTGALLTLAADIPDRRESGRIRFGESDGNLRGGFIRYDGLMNKLHLGTHQVANSDPADDVNAITISRLNGAVGIGMDSPAWPLHVTGDSFFEDRVGIGGLSTEAQLHVEGNARIEGSLGIGTTPLGGVMLDMSGDSLFGLRSETTRVGGQAIWAQATAASGGTSGVYGSASSPSGVGVWGVHTAASGDKPGVYGTTSSTANLAPGVKGEATATSGGFTIGVMGLSHSPLGMGVYGKADTGTGAMGGYFISESAGGKGVYGVATDAAGYAGYFFGRGYFSGDVGIGTPNPAAKLDVAGTARVDVLEITGGADLSEQFDVESQGAEVEPGMVVSIDADHPGKLALSDIAYDRKVAGVVSGAGGVKPGMLMGQRGTVADGEHPVALTGRVWTWCDATQGAIQPGDLLTTSGTLGHAMKVTDHALAQGAIIGKAMSSLDEGKDLVLVLVSLQ